MTEWDAEEYARRSSLQKTMAQEVLFLLQLNAHARIRILDVGCGEGKITAQIAERAREATVVGVDPSHDMIRFAAAHFEAVPNLRFEVADARRLPFEKEFDLVVSFNALHWIPDQEAALRSIRSAIVGGGKAQLRLVPKGPRKSLEDVVEETRKAPRWKAHFADFHDPYLHLTPGGVCGPGRRHRLPRPAGLDQRSRLELWVAHGVCQVLRRWPGGLDRPITGDRTPGFYQRRSRSLPEGNRRWQCEYVQ